MKEYIYPTRTPSEDDWLLVMEDGWRKSGLRFLSVPFWRFHVKTLPIAEEFWMYMYYSFNRSDKKDPLAGCIEYRYHVLEWSKTPLIHSNIYRPVFNHPYEYEEAKTWFKCDSLEEVQRSNSALLTLDDFEHIDHRKKITSCIRSSMAPVICQTKLRIIRHYP